MAPPHRRTTWSSRRRRGVGSRPPADGRPKPTDATRTACSPELPARSQPHHRPVQRPSPAVRASLSAPCRCVSERACVSAPHLRPAAGGPVHSSRPVHSSGRPFTLIVVFHLYRACLFDWLPPALRFCRLVRALAPGWLPVGCPAVAAPCKP